MASFTLGICPQTQFRMSAAIYMSTWSLEFLFNVMDEKEWLKEQLWLLELV